MHSRSRLRYSKSAGMESLSKINEFLGDGYGSGYGSGYGDGYGDGGASTFSGDKVYFIDGFKQ